MSRHTDPPGQHDVRAGWSISLWEVLAAVALLLTVPTIVYGVGGLLGVDSVALLAGLSGLLLVLGCSGIAVVGDRRRRRHGRPAPPGTTD